MSRESLIKKTIWQFFIVFAVALLVLVREYVVGDVSPRTFPFIALALSITGVVFLTVRFTRINRQNQSEEESHLVSSDPAVRKKILQNIRLFQVGVVIMPLFLIYGELALATDGEPMLPRIGGAVVNLGFTWMFFRALRAEKAKLRQLNNDTIPNTTQS